MVSSTSKKIFSLAISLLVVVISLTDVALGAATAPNVATVANPTNSRYTPGFTGAPGKMARDAAGNFYVTDFWGKGIRKFDRNGANATFIATNGRPSAVAVLPDNRLVVAIQVPKPYIAFYSQQTGTEISQFVETGYPALYRPSGITVDSTGKIYVVDAGDSSNNPTDNVGRVRVYDTAGTCISVFGTRTNTDVTASDAATTSFKQPLGIAYEKTTGQIAVVDTDNGRIMFYSKFDSGLGFQKKVGTSFVNGSKIAATVGSAVRFQNPVDVAFEYDAAGAVLNRIYVAERGRNEIVAVDPASPYNLLSQINGGTVAGADMKLPSAVLFEKTTTGGVLYTGNAITSIPANIMALSIDYGTVPVVGTTTLTINPVPAMVTSGSYTALTGSVLPLSQVYCSVNGSAKVAMSNTTNWNDLSPQLPLTIAAGYNYILCETTSGGVTTFAEARTYGGTLPTINAPIVLQPAAGVVTKNPTVTVSGTSDTPGATIKIVNSLASFTGAATVDAAGNWSKDVTLAEGSNLINVTATKGDATSTVVPVTVAADTTLPSIVISFLANSATTVKAVQNIDGIVTDANLGSTSLSSIEVNGVAVPAAAKVALSATDTYFSVPVTLVRGLNTVTVKATDLVGNSSIVSRTAVTYNPDIPGFTVTLPADNSYESAAGTAAASGTVGDPAYTSVVAGDKTVTPDAGGNWSTTTNMTVNGGFREYQFAATAGATTVSEKRTINAAVAPVVYAKLAITSPPADIATKSSSVPIAGSVAAGSPSPTISVDGVPVTPTYDNVTGAFSYTLSFLPAAAGKNHVVKVVTGDVTATTAIRNIFYDTTPPEISIQANANATPSKITGSIEPSAKITAISAKLNGISYSIPLTVLSYALPYVPSSGAVVWTADLSQPISYAYDEGTLTFTAVDPATNTRSITYAKGVPTGDIDKNGKINLDDVMLCLRKIASMYIPPTLDLDWSQADVGTLVDGHAAQDGTVDISDAVLINGKSAGVITF